MGLRPDAPHQRRQLGARKARARQGEGNPRAAPPRGLECPPTGAREAALSDIFKSFTDPIGSLLSKGIGSILDPAGITGLGGKSSGGLDLSAKVAPAKDATPATLIDPTTLPSLTSSDSQ